MTILTNAEPIMKRKLKGRTRRAVTLAKFGTVVFAGGEDIWPRSIVLQSLT
jgi:hypothetical protein